jgi:hypothetical protein
MWGSRHRKMVSAGQPWGRRGPKNGRMPFRRSLDKRAYDEQLGYAAGRETTVSRWADRSPPAAFFMGDC